MGIITDPGGGYTPPQPPSIPPPVSPPSSGGGGGGGGSNDFPDLGGFYGGGYGSWDPISGGGSSGGSSGGGGGSSGGGSSYSQETGGKAPSTMAVSRGEKRESRGFREGGSRVGRTSSKEGRKQTEKNGLKTNEQATVKLDSEEMLLREFDRSGISNSFETELLNGRVALGNIRVSFFVGGKAVRLFDQTDSRREVERMQLESMGFQIVDASPARIRTYLTLKDVISSTQS